MVCSKLSEKSLADEGKKWVFCLVLKPYSHLFHASSESQTVKGRKGKVTILFTYPPYICVFTGTAKYFYIEFCCLHLTTGFGVVTQLDNL